MLVKRLNLAIIFVEEKHVLLIVSLYTLVLHLDEQLRRNKLLDRRSVKGEHFDIRVPLLLGRGFLLAFSLLFFV